MHAKFLIEIRGGRAVVDRNSTVTPTSRAFISLWLLLIIIVTSGNINVFDFLVVLVGEAGVGKSNLCERYLHDRYLEDHPPTLGSDFGVTQVDFGDTQVALHLWDTAGQERFHSMTNRMCDHFS